MLSISTVLINSLDWFGIPKSKDECDTQDSMHSFFAQEKYNYYICFRKFVDINIIHKRNNHFNISEIPMGLPQTQFINNNKPLFFNVVSHILNFEDIRQRSNSTTLRTFDQAKV